MDKMPDFKEIQYVRPNVDEISEKFKSLRLKLMTAQDVNQASDILMEYDQSQRSARRIDAWQYLQYAGQHERG